MKQLHAAGSITNWHAWKTLSFTLVSDLNLNLSSIDLSGSNKWGLRSLWHASKTWWSHLTPRVWRAYPAVHILEIFDYLILFVSICRPPKIACVFSLISFMSTTTYQESSLLHLFKGQGDIWCLGRGVSWTWTWAGTDRDSCNVRVLHVLYFLD